METRKLGNLTVSVVGLGCNQFGATCNLTQTTALVQAALDAGVTFFDVADEYGPEGLAEEFLGKALGASRDDVVVATKFGHHMFGDPERGGASARWIVRAVEDSLQRLGTDRIDLYQQHFPDPATPAEETMAALDQLVRVGKVREIGVCNLTGADLDERAAITERTGGARLAAAQNRLNLLRQEALDELVPAVERHGVALLPYFPLASGMLTGKYRPDQPLPEDSRFARSVEPTQARHMIERDAARVAAFADWARQRGHGVAELAVAWLASMPFVGSVIAGATRPAQVKANVAAATWRLTADEIDEVRELAP
jgi:aryl-alcohol dehydrogenase-like predicted oxidoreductase